MQRYPIAYTYFGDLLYIVDNTMRVLRSRAYYNHSALRNFSSEILDTHSSVFTRIDLNHFQSHVGTTFIDARMASDAHYHFALSSIVPVSLHSEKQALGAAACDAANAFRVSVKKTGAHPHDLHLKDPERVKNNRVEGVGVDVLVEALCRQFAMIFGLLVDVSESATDCWINIRLLSVVYKTQNPFMLHCLTWNMLVVRLYLLPVEQLGYSLLSFRRHLLIQAALYESEFLENTNRALYSCPDKTLPTPSFQKQAFQQSPNHGEYYQMLDYSQIPLALHELGYLFPTFHQG